MPRRGELLEVVRMLRRIVRLTEDLPKDSPSDEALRGRLELAADVLERASSSRSWPVHT
jgi:hypothetical protein